MITILVVDAITQDSDFFFFDETEYTMSTKDSNPSLYD